MLERPKDKVNFLRGHKALSVSVGRLTLKPFTKPPLFRMIVVALQLITSVAQITFLQEVEILNS